MTWFIERKKRRQESQNIDNDHDSLLPQNNDIYSRPREIPFSMSVTYENENVEQSADTISDEKNNTIETIANKATILVHKTTSP